MACTLLGNNIMPETWWSAVHQCWTPTPPPPHTVFNAHYYVLHVNDVKLLCMSTGRHTPGHNSKTNLEHNFATDDVLLFFTCTSSKI